MFLPGRSGLIVQVPSVKEKKIEIEKKIDVEKKIISF